MLDQVQPDEIILETSTLLGDVRSALLDGMRTMPKPWPQMSPEEQQAMIDGCTKVAEHLIRESARIMAANRFPSITGKLVKAQIKDGMQLQVDVSRHDAQRLTIIDGVGGPVLIVFAEPDMFMGERAPARPDKKPDVDGDGVVHDGR